MAKALQCPDCGSRHPLDEVAHLRTFRCRECRRLLKVPAGVAVAERPTGDRGARDDVTRAQPQAYDEDATREMKGNSAATAGGTTGAKVPPSQRVGAVIEQTANMPVTAGLPPSPVPGVVRVVVWLVAIPLGALPVLLVGRAAGLLTIDRAVDVFIGLGWTRFLPPLLMLPVWAASSATIAHLVIEGIARVRARG